MSTPSSVRVVSVRTPSNAEPSLLGRVLRSVLGVVWWIVKFVASSLLLTAVLWYVFGERTVTATLNGKPAVSQVWIDGTYVGDTPYVFRPPLAHSITVEVLPPDDADASEASYTWTAKPWTILGVDVPMLVVGETNAPFSSAPSLDR